MHLILRDGHRQEDQAHPAILCVLMHTARSNCLDNPSPLSTAEFSHPMLCHTLRDRGQCAFVSTSGILLTLLISSVTPSMKEFLIFLSYLLT